MQQGPTQEATNRHPISEEIAVRARGLAARANCLAEQMSDKLRPVMTGSTPPTNKVMSDEEEYPPLFADLRSSFRGISNALDDIELLLLRTEL